MISLRWEGRGRGGGGGGEGEGRGGKGRGEGEGEEEGEGKERGGGGGGEREWISIIITQFQCVCAYSEVVELRVGGCLGHFHGLVGSNAGVHGSIAVEVDGAVDGGYGLDQLYLHGGGEGRGRRRGEEGQ